MATEFYLVHPETNEVIPKERAKKSGFNYLAKSVEDSNYSVVLLKIRKSNFKDKFGRELWEGEIVRYEDKKYTIFYEEGKWYLELMYTDDGQATEYGNKDNWIRFHAWEAKKCVFLANVDYDDFPSSPLNTNNVYDVNITLNMLENESSQMLEFFKESGMSVSNEEMKKMKEMLTKQKKELEKSNI